MSAPLINDLRANVERAIQDTARAQGLSAERTTAILTALRRDGTITRAAEHVRGVTNAVLRRGVAITAARVLARGITQSEARKAG